MVPGAMIMLLFTLLAAHFRETQNPIEQIAFKARQIDLVSRMQFGLSSASEAEKAAVMAITDQDSKTFADQARAATSEVERERRELEGLLKIDGTKNEKDLFVQFSRTFIEFQRIDSDLLSLAVLNTNLKAYSLAFGPAAVAVNEMNTALSHIAADTESHEAKKIIILTFSAQTSALRIETLLAPHIAEESDEKMDKLEALMAGEDKQVRRALNDLKTLLGPTSNADLNKAQSSYTQSSKIRTEILELSRQNTNVRSLSVSLNQKHKATLLC
jgi:hypothetical protein